MNQPQTTAKFEIKLQQNPFSDVKNSQSKSKEKSLSKKKDATDNSNFSFNDNQAITLSNESPVSCEKDKDAVSNLDRSLSPKIKL